MHTSKDRTIFSVLATGVLICAEAHIPLYAWQFGSGSVPQSLMLGRTTPKAVKHCLTWHINQCSHHARRVAAVAHSQAQHNGRDGSQQLLQPPQLSHDGAYTNPGAGLPLRRAASFARGGGALRLP